MSRKVISEERKAELTKILVEANKHFKSKLKEINDNALYLVFGYPSIDAFCKTVFFGKTYNELMESKL